MPGSVVLAQPVGVLPATLSRAFVHAREYPVVVNEYRDGASQRSVQSSTSRKRWRLDKRLTVDELDDLVEFYLDHKGPTVPFYFYDPWETSPKYSHDPSGAATEGRSTVRFEGGMAEAVGIALSDVSFSIVEVQ